MLQIIAKDGNIHGPHNQITKLEDRYDCDGVHLPFTVVGDNCVIEPWVEPFVTEPAPVETT